MSDYLPPMSNDEIERALLNPSHDPEAYALALRHQKAAAREYEAAAMIYGSPFSYRLPPLLVRLPDDNEHPRRYSGNSHQRRKRKRLDARTSLAVLHIPRAPLSEFTTPFHTGSHR